MTIIHQEYLNRSKEYNETSIRLYIIDPILRRLGYPDPEKTYLELEEKLDYPYYHIGRRSKKDIPIGYPDYRAGIKGRRGSFIVEAKAGNIPINNKEIEQAHSYASHPQVGANYFIIFNGERAKLFETLSGPNSDPIVDIDIKEINEKFYLLENILSPENLYKNCKVNYDKGIKLFDGAKSNLRILSGFYRTDSYKLKILMNGQDITELAKRSNPQIFDIFNNLNNIKENYDLIVSNGIIARDDNGIIYSEVKFKGATRGNNIGMQIIKIDEMKFISSDKFISKDQERRTIFETTKEFSVNQGQEIPGFMGGLSIAQSSLKGSAFAKADIYVENNKIIGSYICISNYTTRTPVNGLLRFELNFSGILELDL